MMDMTFLVKENPSQKKNPFYSASWEAFWEWIEREWAEAEKFRHNYAMDECDFCDDWYNCPDCSIRLEQEKEDEIEERLMMEYEEE